MFFADSVYSRNIYIVKKNNYNLVINKDPIHSVRVLDNSAKVHHCQLAMLKS